MLIINLQRQAGNVATRSLIAQREPRTTPAAHASDPKGAPTTAGEFGGRFLGLLEEWRRNAGEGIMLFADADLQAQIVEMKRFDYDSWGLALLGNLLSWVAPVFKLGGALAVSLAGVITAAPPIKENRGDSALTQIESGFLRYLDGLLADRQGIVAQLAEGIVAEYPGVSLDAALDLALADQFKPAFLAGRGLNGEAIRSLYQRMAAEKLRRYRADIQPVVEEPHRPDEWVQYIRVAGVGVAQAKFTRADWQFLHWVSEDMRDEAVRVGTEIYKEYGGWWEHKGDDGPVETILKGLTIGADDSEWHRWTPEHPMPVIRPEDLLDAPDAAPGY